VLFSHSRIGECDGDVGDEPMQCRCEAIFRSIWNIGVDKEEAIVREAPGRIWRKIERLYCHSRLPSSQFRSDELARAHSRPYRGFRIRGERQFDLDFGLKHWNRVRTDEHLCESLLQPQSIQRIPLLLRQVPKDSKPHIELTPPEAPLNRGLINVP